MYFGGKKLLHFDETIPTVDTELLLRNMTFFMKNRRGSQHYKTHVRKFANKHGIKLNPKGLLDIVPIEKPEPLEEPRLENIGVSDNLENGENSPKPFIIYKTNGETFPNLTDENNPKTYYQINLDNGCTCNSVRKQVARNRNHKDYRAHDLENISNKCRLYKEFMAGVRRLHHIELFGVATNIIQIETGANVFKDILSNFPDYYDDDKLDKWDFHIKYINEQDYCPQRCDNFCPYKDACKHTSNIRECSLIDR